MNWTEHLLRSLEDQTATWFVGVVLALLGVFSGRLVETVKFALNRADLRTKYYEQLAVDLSSFVFAVNRLTKVYYGSSWASDEDKSAIAAAYNETMVKLCSQEYVYLSWLQHYWNEKAVKAFERVMEQVRNLDSVLIAMNEGTDKTAASANLENAYAALRSAAHELLVNTRR
jgi:hypothetical protein